MSDTTVVVSFFEASITANYIVGTDIDSHTDIVKTPSIWGQKAGLHEVKDVVCDSNLKQFMS